MKGVREFEEQFEKLGPLMFGLHDGHSEAPKVSDCMYELANRLFLEEIQETQFTLHVIY